jgi:hypothetical protein
MSLARWHKHVIPALRKLSQEYHEFEANLGYIAKSCQEREGEGEKKGGRAKGREREKGKERKKREGKERCFNSCVQFIDILVISLS